MILGFFKTLVTQNDNLAFNKGFYLRQAVIFSLRLFENSYDQKYMFVEDLQWEFDIRFVVLKFSVNLVLFQTR